MKIEKIVNDTEFVVQKKTGGWKGWNIYARHSMFSKYSVEVIQDKKPRLTKLLKEKIVSQAIEEIEIDKYNEKLQPKLNKASHMSRMFQDDFLKGVMRIDKVFKIVLSALEDECENVEVNRVMQRMLDAQIEMKEYSETWHQLKPRPSRTFK